MWWHMRKEPEFVFRWNGRVNLNRKGRQFRRLLAAEVCASAVVMLDTPCSEVVWRVLATQSIRHFPCQFPSRASPCANTFQLDSTTVRIRNLDTLQFQRLLSVLPCCLHKLWHSCQGPAQRSQRPATKTYVKPEAAITFFELLMMSGVSLETCWAIKKQWNNKFHYTVASCWLFLYDMYYDARIHEHQ